MPDPVDEALAEVARAEQATRPAFAWALVLFLSTLAIGIYDDDRVTFFWIVGMIGLAGVGAAQTFRSGP
jgi:uncharacterized membrane protein